MKLNWGVWAYGLLAGVIGGGSTAVVAGVGNVLTDPQTFNLQAGFRHLLLNMFVTFMVAAVLNFFIYLAKHPLPEWDGQIDRRGPPTP